MMNRTTFICCRCCRKCCRHTHTITLVGTQHCASSAEGFSKMYVADVLQMLLKLQICGALAELVYALVLGTSVFGHESSSLLRPTKLKLYLNFPAFTFFIKTVSAILCLKDCLAFASVRST